jgi:phosphatidylinositol alpha-mannosyltransferase
VLASDIPAFARVLEGGRCGALFRSGDVDHLTESLAALLDDSGRRSALDAEAARVVRRYDWGTVATKILHVYETVTEGGAT